MLLIESKKAWERWDTLPDAIRQAIADDATNEAIAAIAKERGIPEDSIPLLARVTGYVLMGFLHADDAAQELQEALSVPAVVAAGIAGDLKQKIFAPYQAQLNVLYTSPFSVAGALPVPGPGQLPRVIDLGSTPLPVSPTASAPAATPMVGTTKIPAPAPAALPVSPSALSIPSVSRMATITPTAPAPLAKPASAVAPAMAPAPFIMHQESSATPLATGMGFKLNISTDSFGSAPARKVPVPMPPKMANLEIGAVPMPTSKASSSFQTKAPEARVVHYTDLRSTIAPATAMPAAPMPPAAPLPKAFVPTPSPTLSVPHVPPAPMPSLSTMPIAQTPPVPSAPKPPKVVNFGSEEVK